MRSVWPLLVVLVAPSGCKDDDDLTPELGLPCEDSADCSELCLPDSDQAPGGLCTQACENDDECPASAACAPAGGLQVCLFACRDDRDCDFLESSGGASWKCHEIDRTSGSVLVCLGE